MFKIKGKYTTAIVHVDREYVEDACYNQIMDLTNNVTCQTNIHIMPDTHYGKSSPIGFTMELGKKLNPEIVSVDISCGMLSVNIGKQTFDEQSMKIIDSEIRNLIPMGFNINDDREAYDIKNKFNFDKVNNIIQNCSYIDNVKVDYEYFKNMIHKLTVHKGDSYYRKTLHRVENSISSLGGG